MHRSKLYALAVLALLAMGAIVSVQANNGVIVPPPTNPGSVNLPGGGYDGPPMPVSPPSGSKGNDPLPELIVTSVESGTYNFRVYRGDSHELVAEVYTTKSDWVVTTVNGPTPGLPPGDYSWTCRVNPNSVSQPMGWSEFFDPYWTFEIDRFIPPTDPVLPPTPVSPEAGSKGANRNPELVVMGIAGAELYHFRVHAVASPVPDLVAEAYTTDPYWTLATLPQGMMSGLEVGTYSWTCRVNMQGSWSDFFQPFWTFTVEKYEPPADGTAGSERPPDPTAQPRARPSPFGPGGTRTRMTLPSNSVNASAAAYSTEGRLVRRLNANRGPNGLYEFPWDGRDETGRSVGAGTYLCQITAGDMHKVVELIKSR